jgi:hypothetical protein
MKLQLDESFDGEFDEDPKTLEDKAVRAAKKAILIVLDGELSKAYQSHSNMPKVGDKIRNTNKKCKHFQSEGVVTAINDLSGGAGKTISYKCTNDGKTWKKGKVLEKTPDQLSPMETMSKALKKGAGGEMKVLEELTKHMAELYSKRIELLKKDLRKTINAHQK